MKNHYFCSEFVSEQLRKLDSFHLKKQARMYLPTNLAKVLSQQDNLTRVSLRDVVSERKLIPWVILLVIGIFFLSFPGYFGQILGTAAFLCLFVYCVYQVSVYEKQRKQGNRFSGCEVLFAVISIILFLCLINHYVTVLSANLALALFFASRAYVQGKHAIHTRLKKDRGKLIPYAADAFISSGLCVLAILSNVSVNPDIMLATGSYLIIISGVEIAQCMWKKAATY